MNETIAGHNPMTISGTPSPSVEAASVESSPIHAERTDADRNGIFASLVKDDTDITGLVAYSIYKQNKLDWLAAFEKDKNRAPDDAERSSYIIGESTPRRLHTYRHLAEATLAGGGPGSGDLHSPLARRSDKVTSTIPMIAIYAIIAVLFVIGFWLAAHFTMASR